MNGVTVYLVIVLPPVLDGAVQLTVAEPLPAVAVTPVGAPGTAGPLGVTALDGEEVGPVPFTLVGAVQLTVADALPAVADTPVGAPGRLFGVTALEGDEAGPVPLALLAATL